MRPPTPVPTFGTVKLNLVELSKQGYYFCHICDGVREVEEAAGYVRCLTCRSFQVSWNPACWSRNATTKS
jgi:hypothetical protein